MTEESPFKILNKDIAQINEIDSVKVEGELKDRIQTIISSSPLVLFMKKMQLLSSSLIME